MLRWTRNLLQRDRPARGGSDVRSAAGLGSAGVAMGADAPPGLGALVNDRYRLESLVGHGSTGSVYRAVDLERADDVAVKILLRRLADRSLAPPDEAAADATPALSLTHPNVARVYRVDRSGRWPFVVMEYVAGSNLHARMRQRGKLPLSEILRIGTSCLDALAYAHARGVLHNDVKPSNLILARTGALKLCDFGLSRLADSSPGAWLSSSSAGAPAYMSPERIRGEACGAASDIYSVGATLYTLATGRTVFGDEMAQAWHGHLTLEPEPCSDLPEPLFEVLQRALAKDPKRRFGSAAEMHAALIEAFADIDDDSGETEVFQVFTRTRRFLDPPKPPAPPPPAPVRRLYAPEGCVRVPRTKLGSKHGGAFEVASFWMMRAPVTNDQYKRFVDETGEPAPAHWLGGRAPAHRGDHPVVGVSLDAARRYALWAGMRLPSDVEWEAAARGERGRAFPWGDAYEATRANGPESARSGTAPVDAHAGAASPCGCVDMVGNAWEWTEPERAEHEPEPGFAWVFGGSFRHPCAHDGGIARTAVGVENEYLYLGFRCALDDEEEG